MRRPGGSPLNTATAPTSKRVHIVDDNSYIPDDDGNDEQSDEASEHKHEGGSEDRLRRLQRMEVDLLEAMNSVAAGKGESRERRSARDQEEKEDHDEEDDEEEDSGEAVVSGGKAEHVCFTIHRDNGLPDEIWIEVLDEASGCPYYFNPETQ
jgi:hypothetical protein